MIFMVQAVSADIRVTTDLNCKKKRKEIVPFLQRMGARYGKEVLLIGEGREQLKPNRPSGEK